MANLKLKRSQNVASSYYVDSTCIDCGTCYWVAPETYRPDTGSSAVYADPKNEGEIRSAYEALLSCPTNSIGVTKKADFLPPPKDIFPRQVEDNVYHTGFHSEKSFGAASFFIQREAGNILIDSPRMLSILKTRFQDMGGIKYQYLTHRDDTADTDLYNEVFNASRIIHVGDKIDRTRHYEIFIEGDEPYQLEKDILIIPVPGHTKGHTVLLYQNKYLFTGDHLCWSHRLNQLYAFKNHCWYDFSSQIKSMESLLQYDFEWVLPGHGAPAHFPKGRMKKELEKCIAWMKE